MTRLQRAIDEFTALVGSDAEAWPACAFGLVDIVATGLADLGIVLPPLTSPLDTAFMATFLEALAKTSTLAAAGHASARTRAMANLAQEHAAYHLAAVTHAVGSPANVAVWDAPARAALRQSLGEFIAHLAQGFAQHGRVPHCGPQGRMLLAGPVAQDIEIPFIPARPYYRYAGNLSAEVQLNFGLPIFIDTADDSVSPDITRTGWWEPWIDGVVRKCVGPGDIAVNVGANLGYHALLMARCVESTGRVYAFEPNPRLIALFQRSLTWGGLLGMTHLMPFAASDKPGKMHFTASRAHMGGGSFFRAAHQPDENRNDSMMRALRARHPGMRDEDMRAMRDALHHEIDDFEVHATTLDNTVGKLSEAIHFLLIDAEGAEPQVLQGGKELIRRSRDLAMVVEWSNGVTYAISDEERARARETVEWLAGEDFKFWRIGGDTRCVYTRPAILDPLTPEEVIGMEGYADIFVCRRMAG